MVNKLQEVVANEAVLFARRATREKTWARSLDVLKSNLSGTAQELVEGCIGFRSEFLVPAEPVTDVSGKIYAVQRHGKDQTIGLTLLYRSDASLHPYFKSILNNKLCTYSEELHSIIIPNSPVSANWMGIIMYHELQHANYHLSGTYRNHKDGYWIEEQQIYRDEIELITNLYGEPYQRFIEKASLEILEHLASGVLTRQQLSDVAMQGLDIMADKSLSTLEDTIRRGAVMVHIGFTVFEAMSLGSTMHFASFVEALSTSKRADPWYWVKQIAR